MSSNAAKSPPGADVSIESMLDLQQQNWRQRIATPVEDLVDTELARAIISVMQAGRSGPP